jgi:predicted DNA-binding protein with PD1-like motif
MDNVEVGYFDPATNSYIKETFTDTHEVLSITGIITHGGSPPDFQPHLHITMSSPNKGAVGGHFFSGRIAATAEFALRAISNGAVHRVKDPVLGLNLLRLHN